MLNVWGKIKELINGNKIISGIEMKTNENVDGKDVYRKRVNLGQLPDTSEKRIAHGLSNVNFIRFTGFCWGGGLGYNLPHVGTEMRYMINTYLENADIVVVTGSNRTGYIGYVDIYYTKN